LELQALAWRLSCGSDEGLHRRRPQQLVASALKGSSSGMAVANQTTRMTMCSELQVAKHISG
jgi:hypothetical protein